MGRFLTSLFLLGFVVTNYADKGSNQQQIIQAAFDVTKQALKVDLPGPVEVEFSGGTQEVEIDAQDGDNIAIADGVTGEKASVVAGKLLVNAGDVSGTFTLPPSTDYSTKTVTATNSWTQLVFSDLTTISSVALKNLGTSTDNLLFAKVANPTGSAYGTLEPGDSTGLPVFKGAQIWYKTDTGTGTLIFTATAVN